MSGTSVTLSGQAPPNQAVGGGEVDFLRQSSGFASWAFTLDHKRIGIMYFVSIMIMFAAGGLFAEVVRTKLLTGGDVPWLTANQYNHVFTMHGIIMVFLVIIPGIPAALGNFVLPIMIGAKDVAFPRLNLVSYYLYVAGALFGLYSVIVGGVDTGWTFYTPYSAETTGPVIQVVTAAFILGFSSIFTGLNFLVTVHKMRAPGMGWFQMPLFIWATYATAIIQILATPVVGITLLLLIAERTMGIGIFTPSLGGDPVLFQHFFWFYSHPAVYIMILPAMGIISEIISTFSRKHIFGYKMIAFSSIAIAVFGFLVWGHHMFTSGQSPLMNLIFSGLTYSVSIPSAIKVFNWLATMYKGNIQLRTPMVYGLSFLFLFGIGGLTGIPLASLSTDIHLHDTYFVVAHFHYVMMGSALIAFFAGLFYWWPKMTGRMYDEKLGAWGAILTFIGFNTTFLPQFVMGSQGMPRRYYHYAEQFTGMHIASSIGAYLLLIGFVLAAVCLIHSLFRGRKAPGNPWGGNTLEWHTASPPPLENFHDHPPVDDPYDMRAWAWSDEEQGYIKVPKPAGAAGGGH